MGGSSADARPQLINAVRNADSEVVVRLIKSEPALVRVRVPFGDAGDAQTLLHLIMPGDGRESTNAHRKIVAALLNASAEVDALGEGPNLGTCTPLTIAAWGGHTDLIELLLRHGADVDGGDDTKPNHPIYAAAWHGHTEAVEALVSAGAQYQTCDLVMAGLNNRLMVELKSYPNRIEQANNDGSTLFHSALQTKASTATLPLLLKHGGNPTLPDAVGRTPLQLAVEQSIYWDRSAEISQLRKYDASTDIFTASGLGEVETVRSILDQDATRSDVQQADGMTPLFLRDDFWGIRDRQTLAGRRSKCFAALGIDSGVA